MAFLDLEDKENLKDMLEDTINNVIEKKNLAGNDTLIPLPSKCEFYNRFGEILNRVENLRF